tara:strand:- start:170 stop:322 length:153 start_codon:yes stop_codon:yes gene_type:complete
MINWLEIMLFGFGAPAVIVFIFWFIDAVVSRKWPFHDRNKKKINAGAKFG